MQTGLTFTIKFNYLGAVLEATVSKVYANGDCIFKLNFPATAYIFIKTNIDWLIVSDFTLCEKLKQKIISRLNKHLPTRNADRLTGQA